MLLFLSAAPIIHAQTPDEFGRRREAVMSRMAPGSVLLLSGRTARRREGFHPNPNFLYLTGLAGSEGFLVLPAPLEPEEEKTPDGSAVLFILARGDSGAVGASNPFDPAKIQAVSGIARVMDATKLDSLLDEVLRGAPSCVYMDRSRSRGAGGGSRDLEKRIDRAREEGEGFDLKSASRLIDPLRRIKSPSEIAKLRRAIDITCKALDEVMRAVRPGMYEYELEAVIENAFKKNGAPKTGFPSIVGSGPNGCILHWQKNDRQTEKGDLVVMDVGAEFEGYSADVTRTIPVNGTFSGRHRKFYEIVLRANEAAIDMVAPGVNMYNVSRRVNEIIAAGLKELGMIENEMEFRRYYYHGMSHPIGLQVHDVGGLGVLEPGMVITIEPGIYVREQGFGIRIEDDVLVTKDGREVLSSAAPKTVEAIEAMMAGKDLYQNPETGKVK
jgi:Xaa-Pro aminopeptidase